MASVAQHAPRVPEWRSIDPAAVGRRIYEARIAAGLSQRQLSFPGCSAAYISRLEAGDRTPSGHLLEELARRVKTTSHVLLTGEPGIEVADVVAAMEDAVRHAAPARAWVAIPHEQWRGLLAACRISPDVQPVTSPREGDVT